MLINILIIFRTKLKNRNMKYKKTFNNYFRFLSFLILLVVISSGNVYSQLPVSVEREMDSFNKDILNALYILRDKNEDSAIREIEALKPGLIQKAKSLRAKLDAIPEFTKDQEDAFLAKQMEKQIFKDFMALYSNEAFQSKINGSPALLKAINEISEIEDFGMGSWDEETESTNEMKEVCTFTVGPGVPNNGNYAIRATEEDTFAGMDGNDQFLVEIHGLSGNNEIDLMLFIQEPKPGKYKWESESQVIIQCYTPDGDPVLELDSYYDEGEIQFDRIDKEGGRVSGSFNGKFFHGSDSENPVTVTGKFNVTRTSFQQ